MSLLDDVFRCLSNCFKHLRIFCIAHLSYLISVFFDIFKLFIYLYNFHMLDQMLDYIMTVFRASTLVDAKSCKMQKTLHFTHFNQKNTHISGCKIVHKCIIATVTAHICMVTVAFAFNILVIFSLSLSLVALTLTSLSLFLI